MNDDFSSNTNEDHDQEQDQEQARLRRRKIREKATPEKKSKLSLKNIIATLVFFLVISSFFFVFMMPKKVVNTWPEAAPLYAKMGMFVTPENFRPRPNVEIKPYASSMVAVGDVYKLTVSGHIINRGQHSVVIPQIIGSLLNASDNKIYAWVFCLPNRTLVRGQGVDYKYELMAAPAATATAVVEIKWERDADGEVIDTCPALEP